MLTTLRARPRPVALGRVLLALGAALTCFEGAALLSRLQEDRITTPVAHWLPAADQVPVLGWFAAMTVAAVLLGVGLAAPLAAGTLAAGNVLLLLTDQQLYSNHRYLLVLLCLWYAVAQSDRAWAIGARARRAASEGLVRWWPQLLVVTTVSACYFYAGLSKANPTFLSGDLIAEMSPAWVPAQLAAWATVPTEIAIGLGIWWSRTRRPALALGAALHISIVALLGDVLVFGAFALLCASAYPLVWCWPSRDQALPAATQRSSVA